MVRELFASAYVAFNRRDIEGALSAMRPDVEWANGLEGGFVRGHEGVRTYWTRQWQIIDPHVEPITFTQDVAGRVVVTVHQIVRDLAGKVIDDRVVTHRYTLVEGLVARMEIVD
jgi:hypothetical protein